MTREIGSEFWEIPISNQDNGIFPESTTWFLSGRCALQAIIADGKFASVALPSWLCESMIRPFVDAGVHIEFYPALAPVSDIRTDAILILDYFGYVGQHKPEGYQGIVIRDVTHSVFSTVYSDADYYFGSLRKWAGFWTGGYAWTKDGHSLPVMVGDDFGYVALREKGMLEKSVYIRGLAQFVGKPFLETFGLAEDALEKCGSYKAHERDVWMARKLDVRLIRERRRENATRLLQALSDMTIFPTLAEGDCPLFVPIAVPDGKRDALRRTLITAGVYCPVHWPLSQYHKIDDQARKIYDEELSLICDQRYSTEDMDYIIEVIRIFGEE